MGAATPVAAASQYQQHQQQRQASSSISSTSSSSASSSSCCCGGAGSLSSSSVVAVAATTSMAECSCCLKDACKPKERIRSAVAFSLCGRRAMVKKLWSRELLWNKWFGQSKFDSTTPPARCFSEPSCQSSNGRLQPWYLIYRWLVFGLWLGVIICSVFEIGSAKPLNARGKWPIYLTNWDLSLGLTQSLLGLIIVGRRWNFQRRRPDFNPTEHLIYGKLEKLYWFLNVVTTSLALGVTSIYWALVHDPRIHQVDALNLLIHVSNSLLMLLDLGVGAVPFETRCFWWCPLLVCLYILFSVAYYAAGGTDKRGEHRIYNILDWRRPGRTLLVCAGGLGFLVVTHCLMCLLARFRDRAWQRKRATKYSLEDGDMRTNQDKKDVPQTV